MSGQTIALSWFLILLGLGAVIFFSVLIVVKRSITRRKSRIGRIAYVSCGQGAPKVWKDYVNQKIKETATVRTEPRVIGLDSADHLIRNSANRVLGFHFRAKTVDLFVDLKELILQRYSHLEAPPFQNLRDFLISAKAEAILPEYSSELIESYCKLYSTARHDPEPYTEANYFTFLEMHHELLDLFVAKTTACEKENIDLALPRVDFQKVKPSKRIPLSLRPDRSWHEVGYRVMKSVDEKPSIPDQMCPSMERMASDNFKKVEEAIKMRVLQPTSSDFTTSFSYPRSKPAPSNIRSAISRSGSTASDDSQTALICLDNWRKTSDCTHDFPSH